MKLNNDCVRDILLFVEKEQKVEENNGDFVFSEITPDLLFDGIKQSKEDIIYTVVMLEQAGFIDAAFSYGNDSLGDFTINSLTYEGHEFIEKIKSENVWGKTKTVSKAVGSASISILSQIATQVISALINQQMGTIF